jgi:hypothetical protein
MKTGATGPAGGRAGGPTGGKPAFAPVLARAQRAAPKPIARADLRAKPATGKIAVPPVAAKARAKDREGLEALGRRRREHDGSQRREEERLSPPAAPPSSAPPPAEPTPMPVGASLSATIERLALQLSRRDAANGPALELDLGGAARVRLEHGPRGVAIAVEGPPSLVAQARRELPMIVRMLRARGVRVCQAGATAAAPLTPPGGSATKSPSGTVAKW